jgi:hypothetical protein
VPDLLNGLGVKFKGLKAQIPYRQFVHQAYLFSSLYLLSFLLEAYLSMRSKTLPRIESKSKNSVDILGEGSSSNLSPCHEQTTFSTLECKVRRRFI